MELDDLDVLGDLDVVQKATLAATLRPRDLAPGAVLFSQGDAAESCYFVVRGEIVVDLVADDKSTQRLATLARGDLLGEVALIDGQPRSATCAAGSSGARVAELARADFDRLFSAGDPVAHAVMDVVLDRLVGRLRGATQRLLAVAGD